MEAVQTIAPDWHSLPLRATRLDFAVRTDTGRVRSSNEDSLEFDPETGLLVLADGMGGCNGGEIASSMALNIVLNEFRQFPLTWPMDDSAASGLSHVSMRLCTAIAKANREIFQQSLMREELAGMGTTLVAALFSGSRVTIVSIGDSRVYRLRHGHFEQLTVDHTVLQEQLECGLITPEQARLAGSRGLITRALGVQAGVEVDVQEQPVLLDDVFLLCSDGLFDMLDDTEIQFEIEHADGDLDSAAQHLINIANDKGGYDNISLILARAV